MDDGFASLGFSLADCAFVHSNIYSVGLAGDDALSIELDVKIPRGCFVIGHESFASTPWLRFVSCLLLVCLCFVRMIILLSTFA